MKGDKMRQMNSEIHKLRKENHQLKMKLQFECKNNEMLMKNITRIRSNYFAPNGQAAGRNQARRPERSAANMLN